MLCVSFVCFVFLNKCPSILANGLYCELICGLCFTADSDQNVLRKGLQVTVVVWSPFANGALTSGDLTYKRNTGVATYMVAMETTCCKWRPSQTWCGRHLVTMATLLVQMATTCKSEKSFLVAIWSPWRPTGTNGDIRRSDYKWATQNITPHNTSSLFSNSLNS